MYVNGELVPVNRTVGVDDLDKVRLEAGAAHQAPVHVRAVGGEVPAVGGRHAAPVHDAEPLSDLCQGCNSIDILGPAQFRAQNPAQNVAQVHCDRNVGILDLTLLGPAPIQLEQFCGPVSSPVEVYTCLKTQMTWARSWA